MDTWPQLYWLKKKAQKPKIAFFSKNSAKKIPGNF